MEIKMYRRVYFSTLAGSILGLLILMVSCARKDAPLVMDITSKQSLETVIDQGELLNSVSEDKGDFIFHFETQDLEVPGTEIEGIAPDAEQWQTIVTFIDHSQLKVPTKGTSLDFIVKRVTLNPSGYNPLAAMVEVNLPTYGRIKVTVHGKNGNTGTITHLCHTQTPNQTVPIFGLYADYDNKVDLTYTDKDGKERGTTQITIKTKALPVTDFPQRQVIKAVREKLEPGVNLMNYPGASVLDLSTPYIADDEGEVRWILLLKNSPDLNDVSISSGLERIKNGNFIAGDQNRHRIVEFDMFGNLIRQWDLKSLGYTFHHDVTEADNGDFLITVSKINAKLANGQPRVQDHIIELDPVNGNLVKEWDLANMVDTARYLKPDGITPPQFSQNPNNWAHNNAIIPFGNNLLATMRYQGIIGFSPAGELRWIISPHKYWGKKYQPYLLNPVDENGHAITNQAVLDGDAAADGFDWAWGPHTPVALSDDRILVFDNGYNRHWISNMLTKNSNYSRVVEYKIDAAHHTVQQIWSYGKERGTSCFAEALSGVQYLPQTGHILFCPGMGVPTAKGLGGRIVEIDPVTKEVVFEMEITASSNTAFHRVTRMPLYPDNI